MLTKEQAKELVADAIRERAGYTSDELAIIIVDRLSANGIIFPKGNWPGYRISNDGLNHG